MFRFLIMCYQAFFSISAGRQCRFEPTCSHYAIQTLKQHHLILAFWLIIKRLWRCSPLNHYSGDWHYDPVKPCDYCNNDTKKPT